MNTHFILKHPITFIILLAALSIGLGLLASGAVLLFVHESYQEVGALGSWSVGVLGLALGIYYFLVDQKRDIRVYFSIEKNEKTNEPNFCVRAFNDSKVGTVVSARRIYITDKVPHYSRIRRDYKKHFDEIPFMEFKHMQFEDYKDYYPLGPTKITPKLLISWDKLLNNVVTYSRHFYSKDKKYPQHFDKCFLTVVFADVKDDPYLFTYPLDQSTIQIINEDLTENVDTGDKETSKPNNLTSDEQEALAELVAKRERQKKHPIKNFYAETYPLLFVFTFIVAMISPNNIYYKAIIAVIVFGITCFFSNKSRYINTNVQERMSVKIFQVIIAVFTTILFFLSASNQLQQFWFTVTLLAAYVVLIIIIPIILYCVNSGS